MVNHDVHHDVHPSLVSFLNECLEIILAAEAILELCKVLYPVTVIGFPIRCSACNILVNWRDPDGCESHPGDIVQVLCDRLPRPAAEGLCAWVTGRVG